MGNPFKFGTIVEEEFFKDRVEEVEYIGVFTISMTGTAFRCD